MKRTILLSVFCLSAMIAGARTKTFTESYLKLRGSDPSLIKSLDRKEIREMIDSMAAAWDPAAKTEREIAKYERGRKLFGNAKQVDIVIDMDDDMEWLTAAEFDKLLRPYEELLSMRQSEMNMSVLSAPKGDKVKELIVLIGAPGESMLFGDIVFQKPVALQDYMDDGDIKNLISFNAPTGNNSSSLVDFKLDQNESHPDILVSIPGYDNTVSYKLEIVQVDGKYGVTSTPKQGNREYIIKPTYPHKPVIYGTNPGNTYVLIKNLSGKEYYMLYDKFGFTVAHGNGLSPVYVDGSEEVAAFIIRDGESYSLYECPETYSLRREGSLEGGDFALRPHIERRLINCRSIVPTADGRLECVLEDGTTEYIPIRKK